MHPVASEGFERSVEAYRRSRPSYPPQAVAWLVEALSIGPGKTVVDVGAGTGKLTALLLPTGARLLAVEPLATMRAALAQDLPTVEALAGMAEALPVDDASADAIIVGQAFHWFDPDRTLREFRRALRPAGRLGVIWNEMDTSVDWVRRFNEIIALPRTGTPHPSAARSADLGRHFSAAVHAQFRHVHQHDRESLLDRVASMSFVAVLPEQERAGVFERVTALIDSHPDIRGRDTFELPYLTEAFWAERRGG
ncbi:class I SAM-dependent methyltransferase [soil metagenome]